ncbi:MAG TPA: hypothetical protein VIL99_09385, partial [Ignavibacteria bacterium]
KQRVQCNFSIIGTFDTFSVSSILIGNYPKVFIHFYSIDNSQMHPEELAYNIKRVIRLWKIS